MKRPYSSEKILIQEVAEAASALKKVTRNLNIGSLIKMIRVQLGMSQSIVAKRAKVPQSTISRLEKGEKYPNLSTLNKIFHALFCEVIVIPMLKEPIDTIRQKQARNQAQQRIQYLKGTMSLEKQRPDPRFIEELLKQEESLLLSSDSDLWKN